MTLENITKNAIDLTMAFLEKEIENINVHSQLRELKKELEEVKNISIIKNLYEQENEKELVSTLVGQCWFRLSKFLYQRLSITDHGEINSIRSKFMTSGIHEKIIKSITRVEAEILN